MKTVEINLEPVRSTLTGSPISVGDEVVYVSMCTKRHYIERSRFLGTRVSKHTFMTHWVIPREVTRVTIRYLIEKAGGRKTGLRYARMMPVDIPASALVGVRL